MMLSRPLAGMTALLAALTLASPAAAQETQPTLEDQIEALQRGQEAIRKELQEIKQLLRSRPAAPSGPDVAGKIFDIGSNPAKGESTAPLTLVEFTDYQ